MLRVIIINTMSIIIINTFSIPDLSVTYTLIVVMLIIMMFSVIALVLSCMSIRKRKKTR